MTCARWIHSAIGHYPSFYNCSQPYDQAPTIETSRKPISTSPVQYVRVPPLYLNPLFWKEEYLPGLSLLRPFFSVTLKRLLIACSPGFPSTQHLKRIKFRRFWRLFPPSLLVAQLHWLSRSDFAQWRKRLQQPMSWRLPFSKRPHPHSETFHC